jgi:hypothetical protein
MSFAKLAGDNPFLLWLLHLNHAGAIDIKSNGQSGAKDIFLDVFGSRRFGLGIHEQIPYLGYVDTDRDAIESVKWTAAAILYQKQGKDWLALSSADARPDLTVGMNPVPLRLFISISTGRLAAWKELEPTQIAIGPMTKSKKGESILSNTPFRTIPLKVM